MPERPRPPRLTDLESRTLRAFRSVVQQQFPSALVDEALLVALACTAVEVLTTGSVSGRRRSEERRRYPDPGSTPERIRTLARWIEASYHTMPSGWVSADDSMMEE